MDISVKKLTLATLLLGLFAACGFDTSESRTLNEGTINYLEDRKRFIQQKN